MSDYNGWANYETWNVALWIGNDEELYNLAKGYSSYKDFAERIKETEGFTETPDGVEFNDSSLDMDALNEMMEEL